MDPNSKEYQCSQKGIGETMDQTGIPNSTSKMTVKPALLALILSLSSSLFCCVSIVLLFGFMDKFHYGLAGIVALCFSILGVISPLIGIIVGVRTLAQNKGQKTMAVTAIILGILFLIATGIVLVTSFTLCCIPM
jgi:hypothetical protein